MAKRRLTNRLSKQLSVNKSFGSSFGSGYLDPDTNILGEGECNFILSFIYFFILWLTLRI